MKEYCDFITISRVFWTYRVSRKILALLWVKELRVWHVNSTYGTMLDRLSNREHFRKHTRARRIDEGYERWDTGRGQREGSSTSQGHSGRWRPSLKSRPGNSPPPWISFSCVYVITCRWQRLTFCTLLPRWFRREANIFASRSPFFPSLHFFISFLFLLDKRPGIRCPWDPAGSLMENIAARNNSVSLRVRNPFFSFLFFFVFFQGVAIGCQS